MATKERRERKGLTGKSDYAGLAVFISLAASAAIHLCPATIARMKPLSKDEIVLGTTFLWK
jgi:hypothetical protein